MSRQSKATPQALLRISESFSGRLSGWESSAAFSDAGIQDDRAGFGLEMDAQYAPADLSELMVNVLGCPRAAAEAFSRQLPMANHLYFAYAGTNPPEYKAYLEFPVLLMEASEGIRRWARPALQILAVKWKPDDPQSVRQTIYVRHPGLDLDSLCARLKQNPDFGRLDFLRHCLDALRPGVCGRPELMDLISVHDQSGGAAKVWDLRLYDLSLKLMDLTAGLLPWISSQTPNCEPLARRWLAEHAECEIGHVSFGARALHLYYTQTASSLA